MSFLPNIMYDKQDELAASYKKDLDTLKHYTLEQLVSKISFDLKQLDIPSKSTNVMISILISELRDQH